MRRCVRICLVSVSKVHSKYSDTTTKILVGNKSLCYLFSLCHLFALMFSIQLMPLIQFNIYCTLHINNNINNNMIVIHFMPLIQFKTLISWSKFWSTPGLSEARTHWTERLISCQKTDDGYQAKWWSCWILSGLTICARNRPCFTVFQMKIEQTSCVIVIFNAILGVLTIYAN